MELSQVPIRLVDHDPAWADRYEAEAERLQGAIGGYSRRVDHIGSTAVPGLAAKPIVDVLVVLDDLDALRGPASVLDPLLQKLGYQRMHDLDGREWVHYRHAAADGQLFNLHLFPRSSDDWRDDLRFREYLRTRPDRRDAYETLKRELADRHRYDARAYMQGKSEFVAETLTLARASDDVSVEG